MAGEYLNGDKFQQAMQMLQAQGGTEGSEGLTEEQKQAAFNQGMADAQKDAAAAGVDAPATGTTPAAPEGTPATSAAPATPAAPAAPPVEDPNAAILAKSGFKDVSAMAEALQQATQDRADLTAQLKDLVAMKKALGNEAELDPKAPDYSIKKAMRDEFGELYEEKRTQAQRRMVESQWQKASEGLADLDAVWPEIQDYILKNPELSLQESGLTQAYHAVRSSHYAPSEKLLDDPDFQTKAASHKPIREKIIKDYLASVAKGGEGVPVSIDGGGGAPMTPAKPGAKTMDDATRMAKALIEERMRNK